MLMVELQVLELSLQEPDVTDQLVDLPSLVGPWNVRLETWESASVTSDVLGVSSAYFAVFTDQEGLEKENAAPGMTHTRPGVAILKMFLGPWCVWCFLRGRISALVWKVVPTI